MQTTLRAALDEFLAYVGEGGDSEARVIALAAINRAVESIWQQHHWRDFQSPDPLQFDLVAGQRNYPLPDMFGRQGLGKVRNLTKGTQILTLDMEEADERYPTRGTSLESGATPVHCVLGGIVGVQRQPDVAGEDLEIVSDNAADTNVVATVVGQDDSGRERRRQFTVTGTTAVDIGAWSYIDDYGKGYRLGTEPTTAGTTSEGTITLRKQSDGTILQELFPEESAREHRVVSFLPKPIAADVVSFPMMRRPPKLRFDSDPLPADWWNAVFEELLVAWRVNTGELAADSVVPRPHLLKLIGLDNANKARPTIRPFGS